MAEEQNATQGEGTEEQTEDTQTVTAEQFAEMKKQLEETRKAQSGSDRTVAELRKALEQKEQEAESRKKQTEQSAAERITEIEKKLQQAEAEKNRAIQLGIAQQLLSEEGIKAPAFIDRLIGNDKDETESLINGFIESAKELRLSAADEYVRKNGRKVTDTGKDNGTGTFDQYTEEQVKRMPVEEFERVFANSRQK